MSGLRRLLAVTLVAGLLPVAAARADIGGPDESTNQAFGPLVADTTYNGSFQSPMDIDYLAFDVARPGESLHFDVANTVRGCTSANLTGCPVYATLIDGQGRQLGGEGSSAGTGPISEYSSSDIIAWTFDAAGRYYVAMDSDGDNPTYSLRYRVVAPGTAGTTQRGLEWTGRPRRRGSAHPQADRLFARLPASTRRAGARAAGGRARVARSYTASGRGPARSPCPCRQARRCGGTR